MTTEENLFFRLAGNPENSRDTIGQKQRRTYVRPTPRENSNRLRVPNGRAAPESFYERRRDSVRSNAAQRARHTVHFG